MTKSASKKLVYKIRSVALSVDEFAHHIKVNSIDLYIAGPVKVENGFTS